MAYCQFKDEYLGMFDDKDIWTTSWLEDLIDWVPFFRFRWQIDEQFLLRGFRRQDPASQE